MNDIKQFKLTSGEEIICDVVEYPDEDVADMVVKNAYVIYMHAFSPDGTRMYSMRPWMLNQDEPENIMVLNSNHVIAEANPTDKLIEHYVKVLMHAGSSESSADEIAEKMAMFIKRFRESSFDDESSDSDIPTNVVKFPQRVVH